MIIGAILERIVLMNKNALTAGKEGHLPKNLIMFFSQ